MSVCTRFEEEALQLWERGESLPDHFAECPDCLAAQEAYARLAETLLETGREQEPHPQWQARVWAEIAQREAPSTAATLGWRRTRWLFKLIPIALGFAVLFIFWRPGAPLPEPSLTAMIESGENTQQRGLPEEGARRGDRINLAATTGDYPYAQIRLYHEDSRLLFSCSDQPPCQREGPKVSASASLDTLGTYQSLLLLSKDPLPPTQGSFDADASTALRAKVELIRGPEIAVH